MKIIKFPDPFLFKKCRDVTIFGSELEVLLNSMWELMIEKKGIGLAANQVGLDMRMFVMIGPIQEKLFIVNPKITGKSEHPAMLREGCLSAPGEFLTLIDRPYWQTMQYSDHRGLKKSGTFLGIHSVCISHELDHLDGISFLENKTIDRKTRKDLKKKWGTR